MEVYEMASSSIISLPQGVATLIVTGTGEKVLLQVGQVYIGGSNVSSSNGLFLSGTYADYLDLGVVAVNEEIYALSPDFNNTAAVMYLDAT
jgi:hypothetical protein